MQAADIHDKVFDILKAKLTKKELRMVLESIRDQEYDELENMLEAEFEDE